MSEKGTTGEQISGSLAASEELLCRLRERIVGFAASRYSREAAEDLAQEVLMVLHDRYSHVTKIEELLPLSLQILRFKIITLQRKAAVRREAADVPVDDLPLSSGDLDPERLFARKEMLKRLQDAVSKMGTRCRQIFRMKLEGRTFEEIRVSMGVKAINTIYTWDFRCRKELLDRMGGRWEK